MKPCRACELEAFHLLDGDWRGSSPKVRSVEEADRESDLFKAQMEMLRSDLEARQQRQETRQDALQQLVQQIQQLSQSMSLNTSANQQRPPAPRYFTLKAGMTERRNDGMTEWRNHGTAENHPKS